MKASAPPGSPASPLLPADYGAWLTDLKRRIQGARQRALLAANGEQIRLYHDIGREILGRQGAQGWGAKVIDQLSADLRAAFPEMKGALSVEPQVHAILRAGMPGVSDRSAVC